MWRKVIIGAFLALLLVQVSNSSKSISFHLTTSDGIVHDPIVPDPPHVAGRKLLTLFAFKNCSFLTNLDVQRTRQIAIDMLADPAIGGVNTVQMRKERKKLQKYVNETAGLAEAQLSPDHTDNESRFSHILGKNSILLHFYHYVKYPNASEEQRHERLTNSRKAVWQALERHGWFEYTKEMTDRWGHFVTDFIDDVLRYVDSLSPAEKKEQTELVEMCRNYEQHTDTITKGEFGASLTQFFFGGLPVTKE